MPSRSARVARTHLLVALAFFACDSGPLVDGTSAERYERSSLPVSFRGTWSIEILSSDPEQVSGGDALVRVEFPGKKVKKDGIGIRVAQEDAGGNYPRDGRGYPTAEATIIGYRTARTARATRASSTSTGTRAAPSRRCPAVPPLRCRPTSP